MARVSKRLKALRSSVEANKLYAIDEAIALVKKAATAKFDESVDVSFNLGVDPRKSDQVIRGSVVLPKGTGKTTRVAVFTQGANADAAKEAGADVVGFEDLAAEIKAGNLNFDVVIASPDAMRIVGQLELFQTTIERGEEMRDLIRGNSKNWEFGRLAFMDVIIMQIALTEMLTFPTIPLNVTFNEYLDIAKIYSTPRSSSYINGLLDHVVKYLQAEKLLLK